MAKEEPKQTNETEAAEKSGFRRARKFAISLNTAAAITLAAAILVGINYLSIRHYKRLDLTRAKYYALSDKTIELLKTIKEPITVVVFFTPESPVYSDIRNLLQEYQDRTPKLQIETVDPHRDLAHARQLVKDYKLDSLNVVVFARGLGESRKTKFVTESEIVEREFMGGPFGGGEQRIKAFKGEQAFTSAIQAILEAKQPTVYFLTGHGEADTENYEEMGYSQLGTYLKRENLAVKQLNLATNRQVPPDCDALVVAGPKRVNADDRKILDDYLQAKGRLLVLLDAQEDSGLEELLKRWGVTVDNNQAVGIVPMGVINALMLEAVGVEYSSHPIVKKLEDENTVFPAARSLSEDSMAPGGPPDRPRATWLVKTPESFWGETDFANLRKPKFDSDADKKGPLTLALAIESGNLPGSDVNLPSTRMVVVGSSLCLANGVLYSSPANLDFFLNAINWLINKPERVLGISPKVPQEFRLGLTAPQIQNLRLWLVFGLPGAVAVVGAVVWWRRRK